MTTHVRAPGPYPTRLRASVIAASLAILTGCGPGVPGAPETPLGASGNEGRLLGIVQLGQRFSAGVSGGFGGVEIATARAAPNDFSPEAIAADQEGYRFVQVNALGLSEPAQIIQRNGPETTIALQSGPTASYDGEVLTATRGFADDLLTVDAPGLLGVLAAGGGSVTRRTETLDDQDQVVTQTFACTITEAPAETIDLGLRQVEARRLDEACRGEALGFDNIYWLDGAGTVLASRQYVSPTVAYLRANRL